MKLNQYPAAIAEAAQAISAIDQQMGELRQEIALLEGKAEMVVAFEMNLKNENQRKARRFEILEANPQYQQLQDQLLRLTTAKSNAIAHLEYVRNQFSVAKLGARWSIAEKLVGLEFREMVGL